jgi:hypothetical protein
MQKNETKSKPQVSSSSTGTKSLGQTVTKASFLLAVLGFQDFKLAKASALPLEPLRQHKSF